MLVSRPVSRHCAAQNVNHFVLPTSVGAAFLQFQFLSRNRQASRMNNGGPNTGRTKSESSKATEAPNITLMRRFFDAEFYVSQIEPSNALAGDPFQHFVDVGWKSGFDPMPGFSVCDYLAKTPSVAEAGVNPFWHFLYFGGQIGEVASENSQKTGQGNEPDRTELNLLRGHFDPVFYLGTYPDVAGAGVEPLEHFAEIGWKEMRDPSADFSTRYYLEANQDVAECGENPLLHYLRVGREERRATQPPALEPGNTDNLPVSNLCTPSHSHEEEMDLLRPHFDRAYYLFHNPDVHASGAEPLAHYCDHGWKEGRDPAPGFSTTTYMNENPDVRDAGVNPFFHFLSLGLAEGRTAKLKDEWKSGALAAAHGTVRKGSATVSVETPAGALTDRELAAALSACARDLVLSISHDDYLRQTGGVQLCIQIEEKQARERGIAYLHVFPKEPKARLLGAGDTDDPLMVVTLDGRRLGYCRATDLVFALSRNVTGRAQVVLHHLMGHHPLRVLDMISACGAVPVRLWLHDFFTICPSYTLQRNLLAFCGAPHAASAACDICAFGQWRPAHSSAMKTLFETAEIEVVAPSHHAMDLWLKRSGLVPHKSFRLPHQVIRQAKRAQPHTAAQNPVRIGFLGAPLPHKGWPTFERLLMDCGESQSFVFYFLGEGPKPTDRVRHVPVRVTADDSDAMVHAISEAEIDLVLHWATWPETFSFTAHEAIAGGAGVLTNPLSGNVAALIQDTGLGAILQDEDDLRSFLVCEDAARLVNSVRAKRAEFETTLVPSEMSFGLIDEGREV